MAAAPNGSDGTGRDRAGRFAPGNRAGRGRKDLARIRALQDSVRSAITPEDLGRVIASLRDAALAGDVQASRVLLERVLGRAREAEPDCGVDLGDLRTADDVRDAHRRVVAAVASGQLDAAHGAGIGLMLDRLAASTVVADLAARLASLEAAGATDTSSLLED